MNHMSSFLVELGVAVPTSMAIATNVSVEPLITALITFGVSVVTLVGGEVIKWLVAFFKKKTQDIENSKDKKE